MFQLKIILRNLKRGGLYSTINIGGLAIGMAAAILIFAWIYHEWSYDRFHSKGKNLYVVYYRSMNGSFDCSDDTPLPLGAALKATYPEITGMTRMRTNMMLYANQESMLKIQTGYTDPDFLTMFDFPLLHGVAETALIDPYSVILTENAAKRLFGNENPMGETLLLDNQYPLTVTGVMKDLPDNTMFHFEALAPVVFTKVFGWDDGNWRNYSFQTFVELQPDARLDFVNESIREIIDTHTNYQENVEVFLYPLSNRYLYAKFENGVPAGGLIDTLRLFATIAGLILLIACINFINLSTARSAKKAKEVGVRKVLGGKRWSLIGLFISESMIISLIAGAIALGLALMVLPVFEVLTERQLTLNLTSIWFWVAGLCFVLFTGLLSGISPALYLSSFPPVLVLKGLSRKKRDLLSSRKVLVVLQFAIAAVLIMSTLVIYRQISYAQDRETGYNKDQLIYSNLDGDISRNYELIKQDLLDSGTAISVTKTRASMTQAWSITWNVDWKGKNPDERINFDFSFTDADWSKTMETSIVEGRDIDVYTYATDSSAMLLNETAVKIMNLENPVGAIISAQRRDWHVVGVVQDFIIGSPYQSVEPMLIGGPAGTFRTMHIKLNGNNSMTENLAKTEQIFKTYNPGYPFEYHFVDEEYAQKFQHEQKIGSLITWFAGLTIFISCMGLFALVAYMAETRRKEIGIRKVLGASIFDITSLLSKEFLILVLISVAVASPIAWWAMERWLTGYAYRTNIPWWLFVVVGCLSVGIALATVSVQAIKAATENPVKSIKSE